METSSPLVVRKRREHEQFPRGTEPGNSRYYPRSGVDTLGVTHDDIRSPVSSQSRQFRAQAGRAHDRKLRVQLAALARGYVRLAEQADRRSTVVNDPPLEPVSRDDRLQTKGR